MMFLATSGEFDIPLSNNYYEIEKWDEVETSNGWKKATDLVVGDIIEEQTITKIEQVDNRCRIYVSE